MNAIANNYPDLDFQFSSNGRVWKVTGVDKKIAQIKLESERGNEIDNFLNETFSKISEGTGFSVEDLKAMVAGNYVKPEAEKTAETDNLEEEKKEETVASKVEEVKEEVKSETQKPAETAKKGTKK